MDWEVDVFLFFGSCGGQSGTWFVAKDTETMAVIFDGVRYEDVES